MAIDFVVTAQPKRLYDRPRFASVANAEDLVVYSERIGTRPDSDEVEEEFQNAWRAVGDIAQPSVAAFDKIAEYTTFHVHIQQHLRMFATVRDGFLDEPWPKWSAIRSPSSRYPAPGPTFVY